MDFATKKSENLQSNMQLARDDTRQLKRGQAKYAVVQPTILYHCNEDKKQQCVCIIEKTVLNHGTIQKEILK